MLTINLTDAKANLSAIMTRLEETGEGFFIKRMGKIIAEVKKYQKPKKKKYIGWYDGEIWMADDFDEWPEEEARALGIID